MSQLDCSQCQDLWPSFDEGLLEGEELSRFKEHLEGCPECRAYGEAYRKAWELLGEWPSLELEPSPDYKVRFWRRVGQEESNQKIVRLQERLARLQCSLRAWPKRVAIAASFLLLSGLMIWGVFSTHWEQRSLPLAQPSGAALPPLATQVSVENETLPGETLVVEGDGPIVVARQGDYPALATPVVEEGFEDSIIYADYSRWDEMIMSQELLDQALNEACQEHP